MGVLVASFLTVSWVSFCLYVMIHLITKYW